MITLEFDEKKPEVSVKPNQVISLFVETTSSICKAENKLLLFNNYVF